MLKNVKMNESNVNIQWKVRLLNGERE